MELEWDPDDEVWVTYMPALGHLSMYGETREKALAQTREAVRGPEHQGEGDLRVGLPRRNRIVTHSSLGLQGRP